MKEAVVVKKILKFPPRFDLKVYVAEEAKDLNTLTMDELHRIMIAYGTRIDTNKLFRKEATFKVSTKQED